MKSHKKIYDFGQKIEVTLGNVTVFSVSAYILATDTTTILTKEARWNPLTTKRMFINPATALSVSGGTDMTNIVVDLMGCTANANVVVLSDITQSHVGKSIDALSINVAKESRPWSRL